MQTDRNERCEAASSMQTMHGIRYTKTASQTGRGLCVELEEVWMLKSVRPLEHTDIIWSPEISKTKLHKYTWMGKLLGKDLQEDVATRTWMTYGEHSYRF